MTIAEAAVSAVPLRRKNDQTLTSDDYRTGRYDRAEVRSFLMRIQAAPAYLRMTLELGLEGDNAAWAKIPELNVAGEGSGVDEALRAVIGAAREWLLYLREEDPELGPELTDQKRYVALLDVPTYGWFKHYRLGG